MPDTVQQLLPTDPFHTLGASLKAAADPLRLEILRVLARGSYGVLELSSIFDIRQSAMSHHLKVLANAALVATRREGNSIFYRRVSPTMDDPHYELLEALFKTLDAIPPDAATQTRLAVIEQERAAASLAFFSANAHKFREQQDLIASYSVYAEHVQAMLENIALPADATALEIGPGEGDFLAVLSEQFTQVIALDNSPAMLNHAQQFSATQGLHNVTLMLGDSHTAVVQNLHADCIVINMVLHHVSSPAEIFQDVGKLLNPGGSLLITDLCRHDQHWATESCGDLWLGFEPQDFSAWAKDAGLEEGQSEFFALRNGFQVQLRHFFKT